MTMIERLSRAIEFADEKCVASYTVDPVVVRASPKWSKAVAQAVLHELLEPTEAMIEAAYEAEIGEPPEAAWKPMIQAAINEGVK